MNVDPLVSLSPPVPADSPAPSPQAGLTRQIAQAVHQINTSSIISSDQTLSLSIDPNTKTVVVRLLDSETQQVLDQVPAEYVLRLADFLASEKAQEGLF